MPGQVLLLMSNFCVRHSGHRCLIRAKFPPKRRIFFSPVPQAFGLQANSQYFLHLNRSQYLLILSQFAGGDVSSFPWMTATENSICILSSMATIPFGKFPLCIC